MEQFVVYAHTYTEKLNLDINIGTYSGMIVMATMNGVHIW